MWSQGDPAKIRTAGHCAHISLLSAEERHVYLGRPAEYSLAAPAQVRVQERRLEALSKCTMPQEDAVLPLLPHRSGFVGDTGTVMRSWPCSAGISCLDTSSATGQSTLREGDTARYCERLLMRLIGLTAVRHGG